jgi:hypothetical protein
MAFEQLVAEAAMKKEKESKKKGKEKKDKDSDKASNNSNSKFGDKGWSDAASAAASDVPNVPKGSSS